MAGTNPTPPVDDDDKPVTEDDLRALKYPDENVVPPKEADEPPEDDEDEEDTAPGADEADDQTSTANPDEDDTSETGTFVKEFDNIKGDTPEDYAKNLEAAYKNSTAEALRLKGLLDAAQPAPPVTPQAEPAAAPPDDTTPPALSATDLYVQQRLDEEIKAAYAVTQKEYPQVSDPAEYTKFTQKVALFSNVILSSEKRLAKPAELYEMAANSLGWQKTTSEPTEAEKLAMAAKDGAAAGQPPTGPTKPKPAGPKISEAQLKLNRKMYPGKTDAEIIEELTPYL